MSELDKLNRYYIDRRKKSQERFKQRKRLHHIVVDTNNYERLKDLGRTTDSFNDVITRMFDKLEKGNK